MTLPALHEPQLPSAANTGTARAARLMRLLGPAAASVWNELSAGETAQLRQAMTAEPPVPERGDAAQFISAFDDNEQMAQHGPQTVWDRLSASDPKALAATLLGEHPQTIALILSRIRSQTAAQSVRALPRETAIDALRRLLHTGRPNPRAISVIETVLQKRLDDGLNDPGRKGHEAVARIFDRLDSRLEEGFLSSIEKTDPGASERIRALMFTFEDLARLDPAAIQTILSRTDRTELATALKGAGDGVRGAFLRNMTKRAGDMLMSEMEALGPLRRSQIEEARTSITDIARGLARRGDILSTDDDDDELIE